MPLTILEDSCVCGVGLLNKHNTGIECHGVAHLRIILLCLTNIWIELVKLICQQSIVCILRRGNIDFDVKIFLTNAVFCKCILTASAFITKGKATRTIDINITTGFTICVRTSALSLVRASSSPVVFHSTAIFINVLNSRVRHFILLTSRKSRSGDLDNAQVWALLSQQVRIQLAAHVRNIIAGVALNHFLCILCVCNKVVEDLVVCQVHHVGLHTVNQYVTIRRTNRNAYRRSLCEVIACVIQFNTAGNTVQPQNHFFVLTIRQNIELKLHKVIFAGGQGNTVLFAGQRDLLRLNIQTNAAIQASQCCSIVVLDIRSLKHKLKVLTQLLCVITKQLITDICSCTSFHTEVGIAIFVQLITAIRPVKVITDSKSIIAISPQTSLVRVGLACRIKVEG